MPNLAVPDWAQLTPSETLALTHSAHELGLLLADHDLPFEDYMEWALYNPACGYYTQREIFGARGDYVTAPLLSPLFGHTVARQCAALIQRQGGSIMEVGAGNGRLGVDIMKALEAQGAPPERYWMIERSPLLRNRARALVASEIPQWTDRVMIGDTWPEEQATVILANELIDALPARRFRMRDGVALSLSVSGRSGELRLIEATPDPGLTAYLKDLALPDGYESEAIPSAQTFLHEASGHLAEGLILLIDYGFPRREFYHPERHQGTLMCHFRQRAHADPFVLPGLQDITCHVDFTSLAQAACNEGLSLAGYTSQAAFLLSLGLVDDVPEDGPEAMRCRQAIKRLTLPHEMGEIFKVIAFSRGLDYPLQGFHLLDRRRVLES